MFKKKGGSKPKGLRRRDRGEEEEEQEEEEQVATEEGAGAQKPKGPRKPGEGVLGFSSSAGKKQRTEEPNRPRTSFAFESKREVQVHTDSGATATLETETELDRDARALREKYLKRAEEALKGRKGGGDEDPSKGEKGGASGADPKVYRGVHGYVDHTAGFRREHTVSGEKSSGAFGPLRASSHIRMSVRFDYQPDICKDYKETGFCGYGDACKFMHDRGDYKSGWQLEREWDEKEKKRKEALAMGLVREVEGEGEEGEDSDEEDELPFACFICRQPFVDPVATKCQHYFCEHCALRHNSRNKNCFVCNKPTGGVFNTAHEIVKKMKERAAATEASKS